MTIQITFVAVFALNIALIWATYLTGKLRFYPAVGQVILTALPFVTVFYAQPQFELDYFWWRIAGIIAIVLGLAVIIWAVNAFQKAGLFLLDVQSKLVTSGPYKYVRHPQYLGLVLVAVGWWWVWAAVYSFYFGMFMLALIWINARLEERLVMEKRFGDAYRQYRRKTGMFWIK